MSEPDPILTSAGDPGGIALSLLISRVADECTRLTLQIDRIQEMAAGLVVEAHRENDPTVVREIQALDHLTQTAAGLAAILNVVAQDAPGDPLDTETLGKALTLGSLAERLIGRANESDGMAAGAPLLF